MQYYDRECINSNSHVIHTQFYFCIFGTCHTQFYFCMSGTCHTNISRLHRIGFLTVSTYGLSKIHLQAAAVMINYFLSHDTFGD